MTGCHVGQGRFLIQEQLAFHFKSLQVSFDLFSCKIICRLTVNDNCKGTSIVEPCDFVVFYFNASCDKRLFIG